MSSITGREFKLKYKTKLYIEANSDEIEDYETIHSVYDLYELPNWIKIFKIKYIKEVEINDNSRLILNSNEKIICAQYIKLKERILLKDFELWKNRDFCYNAVYMDPYNLKYSIKTNEIIDLVICRDGKTIKYIDKDLQTYEICKISVQNIGLEFKYVNKELQTAELYDIASKSFYNNSIIKYIRKDLQTYDLCKNSIEDSMIYLRFIRKDLITRELFNIIIDNCINKK